MTTRALLAEDCASCQFAYDSCNLYWFVHDHQSSLRTGVSDPVSWDLTLSKAGSEVGSDQEPLVSRLPDVFALDEPRLLPTRSRRILFAIEAAYVSDPDEGVSAHESSRSVEVKS